MEWSSPLAALLARRWACQSHQLTNDGTILLSYCSFFHVSTVTILCFMSLWMRTPARAKWGRDTPSTYTGRACMNATFMLHKNGGQPHMILTTDTTLLNTCFAAHSLARGESIVHVPKSVNFGKVSYKHL